MQHVPRVQGQWASVSLVGSDSLHLNRLQCIVLQDMLSHADASLQQISCVTAVSLEQLTAGPGLTQPFWKYYWKLALQPFLLAQSRKALQSTT